MATPETKSEKSNLTRILVVDDHPVVRQGLTLLIDREADLEVCGEADGLAEAIRAYRDLSPDLTIADLTLKNGSGIELIKELVALDERVMILVVSMHDETLFAERALRAGAKGYIRKEETTEKMADAIRAVLAGRVYLSDQMTDRMLTRSIGNHKEELEESPITTLSDRELEVFEQIGRGVSTKQIADKLHLSPKTVETYRENIKSKLNLKNATELTQHAVQWVLEQG